MSCLGLLIGGSLGRRQAVAIGMRDGTQLGNEQRQRSQGYDANFDAMRPFEQGQPITMNARMLPLFV